MKAEHSLIKKNAYTQQYENNYIQNLANDFSGHISILIDKQTSQEDILCSYLSQGITNGYSNEI